MKARQSELVGMAFICIQSSHRNIRFLCSRSLSICIQSDSSRPVCRTVQSENQNEGAVGVFEGFRTFAARSRGRRTNKTLFKPVSHATSRHVYHQPCARPKQESNKYLQEENAYLKNVFLRNLRIILKSLFLTCASTLWDADKCGV